MRIAQVSPLYESVPPKGYGGTERVVSYLTEELVKMGHEVTLYASGDSDTSARLRAMTPKSLRTCKGCIDHLAHHVHMLEMVAKECRDYDLIHWHCDYMHFPISRRLSVPHMTTLHGRLDIVDLQPLYNEFNEMPLVSISNAQRAPLPQANWIATVYHGLPVPMYTFQERPQDYVAFLGRISPEKRLDRAIEIAKAVGLKLKVAAKIDRADEKYYAEVIEPIIDDPMVEFIGEVGEMDKCAFAGNARALLFPIDWPEPFGLVMIEALACGTPVIAFRKGSVPEVMEHGVTGYVVDTVDEAIDALKNIDNIDRRQCRRAFLERFSAPVMAESYTRIYERLLRPHNTVVTEVVDVGT